MLGFVKNVQVPKVSDLLRKAKDKSEELLRIQNKYIRRQPYASYPHAML